MGAPRTALDRDATVRRPHRVSQQTERWNARSADGLWDYERLEDSGTTWRCTYRPSITPDLPGGRWFLAPSLPKARALTADPAAALALLEPARPAPRCAFVSTAGGCRTRCPEPATPGHTSCPRHGGITA
jgi:hypothetical protein